MNNDKIDFDKLPDCLNCEIDNNIANCVDVFECEKDALSDIEKLRNHFLEVLPEGYTKEEIRNMSEKELIDLKSIYDYHCF
ncbi:MAG: hypothetical protein ACI4TX_01430 [Christensenellales bacterium]